jgi:hypothetical protein
MTVQYVVGSILAPTCGEAACHSSFAANRGYVFDTVDAARHTLIESDPPLIQFDANQYDPAKPALANLIIWLTETDPFALGYGRMPLDGPMPNEDVYFLEEWIQAHAPGAECDPKYPTACDINDVVLCGDDWNFGPVVDTCATTCVLGTTGAACSS